MAEDPYIDAFLELKPDGKSPLEGETQDKDFAAKKAIQLLSFSVGFEKDDIQGDDNLSDLIKLDMKAGDKPRKGSLKPGIGKVTLSIKPPKKAPYSFRVTKLVDVASAQLFFFYCQYLQRPINQSGMVVSDSSATIDTAQVTFRKGGGDLVKYLRIYFENLTVVDYKAMVNDGHPTEEVVFGFNKCELAYDVQEAAGTKKSSNKILSGWDFGDNTVWTHTSDNG